MKYIVVKGGSWYYFPQSCRVVNRHGWNPTNRHNNVGFMIAKNKKSWPKI
jgi:formylglycine-generating enzyme required for sulfatase activity